MTKAIGEENLQEETLTILALLNMNYWQKNKSKEDLIMNYAVIDKKTQAQLNAQLEKENIFTKISNFFSTFTICLSGKKPPMPSSAAQAQ